MVDDKRYASEAQDIEREKAVTEPSEIMPEAEKILKPAGLRKHHRKHWETAQVNCLSTTIPTLITKLYGGQSITLRSAEGTSASHWLGPNRDVTSTNGFQLDGAEKVSISLPASFGVTNFIEIWAIPENANKKVHYLKVIDTVPITSASN